MQNVESLCITNRFSIKSKKFLLYYMFLGNFLCFLFKSVFCINQNLLLSDTNTLIDGIFLMIAMPSSALALLESMLILIFKQHAFLPFAFSVFIFLIFPFMTKIYFYIIINILEPGLYYVVCINDSYSFLCNGFFDGLVTLIGVLLPFLFRLVEIKIDKKFLLNDSLLNVLIHIFIIEFGLYVCYVFSVIKTIKEKFLLRSFLWTLICVIGIVCSISSIIMFKIIHIQYLCLFIFIVLLVICALVMQFLYQTKIKIKYLLLKSKFVFTLYYSLLIFILYFMIIGFRFFHKNYKEMKKIL